MPARGYSQSSKPPARKAKIKARPQAKPKHVGPQGLGTVAPARRTTPRTNAEKARGKQVIKQSAQHVADKHARKNARVVARQRAKGPLGPEKPKRLQTTDGRVKIDRFKKGKRVGTRTFRDGDDYQAYVERRNLRDDARRKAVRNAQAIKKTVRVSTQEIKPEARGEFNRMVAKRLPENAGPKRKAKVKHNIRVRLAQEGKTQAPRPGSTMYKRRKKLVRTLDKTVETTVKVVGDGQLRADRAAKQAGLKPGRSQAQKRRQEEKVSKAQHQDRVRQSMSEKRRGGGAKQLVENAKDEVVDLATNAPAIAKQTVQGIAGMVGDVVERSNITYSDDGKAEHIEAAGKDIKETSPLYSLIVDQNVKEALGRAKERPLSALGEVTVVGAAPARVARAGTASAKGAATAPSGARRQGARDARKTAAARRVARPARQPRRAIDAPQPRAAIRAEAAKARTVARERAAQRARGERVPVQTGERSYSKSTPIRVVQKGKDRVLPVLGRDPNVASKRQRKRAKAKATDADRRNLQAAGLRLEEQAATAAPKVLKKHGIKKEPDVALATLLAQNRVSPKTLRADLERVRVQLDVGRSTERRHNLSVIDTLLARETMGAFEGDRLKKYMGAADDLSKASRALDKEMARRGVADPERLEYVARAQGPIGLGDIVKADVPKDRPKATPPAAAAPPRPLPEGKHGERPAELVELDHKVAAVERKHGVNSYKAAEARNERKLAVDAFYDDRPTDAPDPLAEADVPEPVKVTARPLPTTKGDKKLAAIAREVERGPEGRKLAKYEKHLRKLQGQARRAPDGKTKRVLLERITKGEAMVAQAEKDFRKAYVKATRKVAPTTSGVKAKSSRQADFEMEDQAMDAEVAGLADRDADGGPEQNAAHEAAEAAEKALEKARFDIDDDERMESLNELSEAIESVQKTLRQPMGESKRLVMTKQLERYKRDHKQLHDAVHEPVRAAQRRLDEAVAYLGNFARPERVEELKTTHRGPNRAVIADEAGELIERDTDRDNWTERSAEDDPKRAKAGSDSIERPWELDEDAEAAMAANALSGDDPDPQDVTGGEKAPTTPSGDSATTEALTWARAGVWGKKGDVVTLKALKRYHAERGNVRKFMAIDESTRTGIEGAFFRMTKPKAGEGDNLLGGRDLGVGYNPDDLLGRLGDKERLSEDFIERQMKINLKVLGDMATDRHAYRENGEVAYFDLSDDDGLAAMGVAKNEAMRRIGFPHKVVKMQDGRAVLMPEFVAKRIEPSSFEQGTGEKLDRWVTRKMIRAMLPLSVAWHVGNQIDLSVRLALSLEPRELMQPRLMAQTAGVLEKQLRRIDPVLAHHVLDSLQGHFGSRRTMEESSFGNVIRTEEASARAKGLRNAVAKAADVGAGVPRRLGVTKAIDAAFDLSAGLEQKSVNIAVGAAARAYARDLGVAVRDHVQSMEALARELDADPKKVHELQNRVLEIVGDFSTKSPTDRKMLRGVDIFWAWFRESHRFVLSTLPEKHPKRAALLLIASSLTAEEREMAGLNSYWNEEELSILHRDLDAKRPREGFLAGSFGDEDSPIPTSPWTSFGEVSRSLAEPEAIPSRFFGPVQRVASAAAGFYRTPAELAAARVADELDPKGGSKKERSSDPDIARIQKELDPDTPGSKSRVDSLRLPDGVSKKKVIEKLATEALVPVARQARTIGEQGTSPDYDSTWREPSSARFRPDGKAKSIERGIRKVTVPWEPATPFSKPKEITTEEIHQRTARVDMGKTIVLKWKDDRGNMQSLRVKRSN